MGDTGMTEKEKELKILQVAKQTKAYLDGVALLYDIDPMAVVRFIKVSYGLQIAREKK
jgi:hypothetical protein